MEIIATKGTASYLKKNAIKVTQVNKAHEGRPNILELLSDNKIDLVFNTTEWRQSIKNSRAIRTTSVAKGIAYCTSATGAWAAARAMKSSKESEISIISLQELKAYQ